MTSTDQTNTVIGTEFGLFRIQDARTTKDRGVEFLRLYPVGGTFTINRKTYTGSVALNRYLDGDFFVTGDDPLSDSAREKLAKAVEVLGTEYPPLTHEEKVAYVKRQALHYASTLLDGLVPGSVNDAVRRADMDPYYPTYPEDRPRLTENEVAEIRAAVLTAVREQVNSDEFGKRS